MGRKRNQGKARKAAKAKAREEAEESHRQQWLAELLEEAEEEEEEGEERGSDNNQPNYERQQSLAGCGAQMPPSEFFNTKCKHGLDLLSNADNTCFQFVHAFEDAYFYEASGANISVCLIAAEDATLDKFADVWDDSAKMEIAISFLLCTGTQYFLKGNYADARHSAVITRYFEQRIAVGLKQTQALVNWPKINEVYEGDVHTLVKFFRKRIPCSCLDAKYDEVKSITKMGVCYNPECSAPLGKVERSKTMYCSRCRCVTYCSPECQKADWKLHRPSCDECVARIAKFDAKREYINIHKHKH
ncbi:hypothetical protein QTG54_015008 [Skeletonema marinoi]|uniref:MYND-type domain-containing protein n=1 Tax=Skeletonema marinoi TaxID=267567 RepID=A0AAD8XUQ8_9STRA|nr:hypothetical protein QTG54_015008 [Skeletonema marinoi]